MKNDKWKPKPREITCWRCGKGYGTLVKIEEDKYQHQGKCPKEIK